MSRWILVVMLVEAICLKPCFSQNFIQVPESLVGVYQKNLPFYIKINTTGTDKLIHYVQTYVVDDGGQEKQFAGGSSDFGPKNGSQFDGRVKTYLNETANTYTLIFSNLQYDDDVTLKIVLFHFSQGSNIKVAQTSSKINVTGGPTLCGAQLQSSYEMDMEHPTPISLVLCGNSQPTLRFTYGSFKDKIVTNVTAVSGFKHRYQYVIQLKDLKASDCNLILTYRATGESTALTGQTKIDLRCFSQNFIQVPESLVGVYQQKLSFYFKINITGLDILIKDVQVYVVDDSGQGKQFAGGSSDFGPKNSGSQFDGRVNAFGNATSNTYTLIFSNLQYDDDVAFKIVVIYSQGSDFQVKQRSSKINVIGGPTLCGAQLQSSHEMDMEHPTPISLVLCGNSRPTLTFTFGSFKDENVTNITAVSAFKHRYQYVIQLRHLKASDCNLVLTYRATVESTALTGQTKIDLRYTPNVTNITAIREGLCLTTTWNGPLTGTCLPFSCQLQYYLSDGFTHNFIQVPESLVGVYQQKLSFYFKINTTGLDRLIQDVKVYVVEESGQEIQFAGGSSDFGLKNHSSQFDGRVNAAGNATSNTYTLIFSNLQYDDDVAFRIVVLYSNGSDIKVKQRSSKINVTGGPTLCGSQLQSSYEMDMKHPTPISLVLCGNSQPTLTFTFGSFKDKNVTNVTTVSTFKHRYQYVIQLKDLKASDCNLILTYRAAGESTALTGQTKIDLRCFSQNFIQVPESLVGVYQQKLSFYFKINITGLDILIKDVQVYVVDDSGQGKQFAGGSSDFGPKNSGSQFDGRVNAFGNATSNTYTLIFSNLQYDDDVAFRIVVLYSNGSDIKVKQRSSKINVTGGPTLCGAQLQSSYEMNMEHPTPISLVLCGNSQPTLTFTFGGFKDKNVTNVTAVPTFKHRYQYVIQLRDLKASDCNLILTYRATGESTALTGQTKIDLRCFTQNFIQVPESLVAVYQQSLPFYFKINTTGLDRLIQDVKVYVIKKSEPEKQFAGGLSDFGPKQFGSQFDGRVNAVGNVTSNTYTLIFSNLQYDDDVVLKIVVFYSQGSDMKVEQRSKINVTGGPTLCEAQLQSSYEMDMEHPNPIYLVLCGNSRPTLKFTFGSFKDETVTNVTAVSGFKHRYQYVIQLRNLKTSDYNSTLTYRATGESTALTGQTKIDLRWGPKLCGAQLQSSYEMDIEQPTPISLVLCGNSRPTLTFTIGSFKNETVTKVTAVSGFKHRYQYVIQLRNLTTSDFNSTLTYRATGESTALTGQTKIDLRWGPTLCGAQLQSLYEMDMEHPTPISLVLCGNSRPTLKFTFGSFKDENVTDVTTVSTFKHRYQYIILLVDLTTSDCNLILTYRATGESIALTGQTKIDLKCFSQNFIQVPESLQGVYQQSLPFYFKINTTGLNRLIQDVKVYVVEDSGQEKQFAGGLSDFGPKNFSSQFDGRVNAASNATSNTYTLIFSNLHYDDDVVFRIVVLLSQGLVKMRSSKVIVTGGPTLCGTQLQSSYEMDMEHPTPILLVLCGNSKPTLKFTFGSFKNETVTNVMAVLGFKHRYQYVIQLRDLKTSDCNSILTYRATVESTALTGQTKIYLRFTPNITNITAKRDGLCLNTTWNGPHTGNCPPVSYQLQYYWVDGNITNITLPAVVNQTSHVYCAEYLHHVQEIYQVTVHGTFKGNTTIKHCINVTHIIPTTTTTTTTTMTTTVSQNNSTTNNGTSISDDSSDTDVVLIAALGGGVGSLVILFVVLLIFCVWCKKRDKTKQLQMHSIHENDSNHKSPKKKSNRMYSIDTEHPAIELGHQNGTVHIERLNHEQPGKVADAQFNYYSPEEVDDGYTFNQDKYSPPVSPALLQPTNILYFQNRSYQRNEEENEPEFV